MSERGDKEMSIINNVLILFQDKLKEASEYFERCGKLVNQLDAVNSKADFESLVHEVIKMQQDLKVFLGDEIQTLDAISFACLKEKIDQNSNLSLFSRLISFDDLVKQPILSAKERLSTYELKTALPEKKSKEAVAFIETIKQFEDVSKLLYLEANSIRQLLRSHPSEEDLNYLEDSVTQMSNTLLGHLKHELKYPEDEETAHAIVNYLNNNPHIKGILQSFDFHEKLADEFLAARATTANGFNYPAKLP